MKKNLFFLFLFFSSFLSKSQLNDNIWPLSYYWGPSAPYYKLDFSSGNPDTIVYQGMMSMYITNASVSDSSGNILYYTNGQWLSNKINDTLLGSQNFNPGWGTNYYLHGLGYSQSAIFLQFEESQNFVYLVHNSLDTFYNIDGDQDGQPFNLRYSLIDKTLDNGNGGIVNGLKGVICINDTLLLGRITACKHANGRDWWVLAHKYYSDVYYKLLFTPYGILGPFPQQIGPILRPKGVLGIDNDLLGMAVFSPDGSKYVNTDYDTLQLFDFDRCSGMLSNLQNIYPQITDSIRILGCNFSSDSRFLYANTRLKAFQIDTYSSNINGTINLVAIYDGFVDPSSTWFFMEQLGPDGKIYISTYGGCYSLHVIENPDSLGINCNFIQHSYILPSYIGGNLSLPNFPNYRLGALIGSGCDTLTSLAGIKNQATRVRIFSNPNNGNFIIEYSLPQNKSGTLTIYNTIGEKVYSMPLPQWSIIQRINIVNLPNGVYLCNVSSQNHVSSVKFIVSK